MLEQERIPPDAAERAFLAAFIWQHHARLTSESSLTPKSYTLATSRRCRAFCV